MHDRSSPSRFHFPSEMYHHHPQHHQSTKRSVISPSPPPCRCCHDNRSVSPENLSHRRSPIATAVPKLLRYDQGSPSPTNPDLYHHGVEEEEDERQRSVSVIRAHHDDFPSQSPTLTNNNNHHKSIRRTNSVSSVDQQSMDSHSERSFDSRSPHSPFSTIQQHFPTSEQSSRSKHSNSKDFYRNHQQQTNHHRERVRFPQDMDLHHLHEQRAVAMKSLHIREPHHHHHHQHREDYHEIPSPNYPHPPPSHHHHHHIPFNPASLSRLEHGQNFTFSPYLEANLRHKFAGN